MKKFITLLITILSTSAFAQKTQFEMNTGYGLGIFKEKLGYSVKGYYTLPGVFYYKPYISSLGNGTYLNVGLKIKTDSISFIGISARYWNSSRVKIDLELIDNKAPFSYSSNISYTNNVYLCFTYGLNYRINKQYQFNARAGFMAGKTFMRQKVIAHVNDYTSPGKQIDNLYFYDFIFPLNFGITGELRGERKINDKWNLTASLGFQLMNVKPSRRALIRAEGQITPQMQNYINEGNVDFYTIYDSFKHVESYVNEKKPPISFPMSAAILSFGATYTLK